MAFKLSNRSLAKMEGVDESLVAVVKRAIPDLFVIAPASANTIGNIANGLAPDPLTSIYLATKAKVLIAPAMNGKMWEHPATQRNIKTLKHDSCNFIGPEQTGMLACGYEGKGRLQDVPTILKKINSLL